MVADTVRNKGEQGNGAAHKRELTARGREFAHRRRVGAQGMDSGRVRDCTEL